MVHNIRFAAETAATQHTVRTTSPVLVKRSEELRTLVAFASRPPSTIFIEGEAGVGKTRIVHETLAHPRLTDVQALVGHCQALHEPFPYGVVLDALRQINRDRLTTAELNPVTGALRPHLPELAGVLPPCPEPLGDTHAERHRLFRAVRQLLGSLGRAVLIVEDLHWSDDGSRNLLRFLISEPPANLSVLLTYRRQELPGGIPLGSAYRPPVNGTSITLAVHPLDVAGVQQLTSAILGDCPVSADFATRLHERTAGIPFVVEETLRALRNPEGAVHADGVQARRLLDEVEVPALLREATLEQLSRLSATARLITHAAAVVGMPASSALLGELAQLPPQEARAALTSALDAGILLESSHCRYDFRHALARQAVYWTLPGPQREQLHLRAATALAETEPRPLVQLAEHSRKAGAVDHWLRYAEAAADHATDMGDVATATSALHTLLTEADLAPPDVGRLAAKLSRVAYTGLSQHEVAAALERLVADHRLPTAVRGEVRLALGLLLNRQEGSLEAGRVEVTMALDELHERPQLQLKAMSVLALPYIGTVPIGEHLRWMAEVDKAITATEDPSSRLELLANNGPAQLIVGSPMAWRRIGELPETVSAQQEQRHLARAYCNVADSCSWVGYYQAAASYLHSGIRMANDCGAPFIVSTARSTQVHLDWLTGHWHGLAERTGNLLEEYHHLLPVASELSLILGCLAVTQGQWERAAHHLGNTAMDEPNNAYGPVAIAAHAATVRMHIAQNRQKAAKAADRGVDLVRRMGAWPWAAELVPAAVAVYCRAGRESEAADLTRTFTAAIADLDVPVAAAALPMCHGLLAARRDDPAADRYFDQARARAAALPAPYFAAMATEQHARWRLRSGDPTSTATFAALADEFDTLGATHDAARCRYVLRTRGAGQPSRRGRRGYGDELSPRERDVSRLLADGHKNREIAQILFLSPRTVEQHVARVLRKLKVGSREQLRQHLPERDG